jgi:2-C-methyl-D-erythritol 4-phosphate cytidylyltransferase / 2-C-methyl-D-erythritol 2,4-cyclodiphosphate synthase
VPVAAIIVAAGRGVRAGDGLPKQYRSLEGQPVIARAIAAFSVHPRVERIQPVVSEDDRHLYDRAVQDLLDAAPKLCDPVVGGATRQVSVRHGLEALARSIRDPDDAVVLIHDAARPFADIGLIDRAIDAGRAHGAAVPGVPVTDTVKVVDGTGRVVGTPPRDALRAVQTPQAFAFAAILAAHRRAVSAGLESFTDDGALAEWAGLGVTVFEGDPANVKLTRPADFDAAEQRLRFASPADVVTRVGTGFDVHAFGEGDHVWLGGVRIAHERGVLAHSDGDVVLHALTDALLGALCDGDIGVHFPPSDPQWRGASSDRFLTFAAERVRARGVIDHLDVTVLCERPRIGPYRDAMRERIAGIAGVPAGSVSVKATTTERLGFTGRGEGLAAQAVVTVRLGRARS